MKQHISLSGQFRIVKKSSDNQVLFDSGVLNNLLLDTGLDYFGDNTGGGNILQNLAIGTGNSEPVVTQNRLDNIIAIVWGNIESQKDDYNAERDGEYFTASQTYKYIFNGLNNVNIAELGLVSNTDKANYIAYTRALIKDDSGRPLVITVLQGETLEVYYTMKQVYHLKDKAFTIALSDGRGGVRGTVNGVMRLCGVGGLNLGGNADYGRNVGSKLNGVLWNNDNIAYNTQQLGQVTGEPKGNKTHLYSRTQNGNYQARSHKGTKTITIDERNNLPQLGALVIFTTMGFYQISFANQDGSMIDKNRTRTFSVTLEISWGRDERG